MNNELINIISNSIKKYDMKFQTRINHDFEDLNEDYLYISSDCINSYNLKEFILNIKPFIAEEQINSYSFVVNRILRIEVEDTVIVLYGPYLRFFGTSLRKIIKDFDIDFNRIDLRNIVSHKELVKSQLKKLDYYLSDMNLEFM